MISDPITITPEQKIADAQEIMNKFGISGLPVTKNGKLVGILTNRDLRFEKKLDRLVAEVMTKDNLVTVQPGVDLDDAKELLHQHRIEKLLVVDDRFRAQGVDHGQGHREEVCSSPTPARTDGAGCGLARRWE